MFDDKHNTHLQILYSCESQCPCIFIWHYSIRKCWAGSYWVLLFPWKRHLNYSLLSPAGISPNFASLFSKRPPPRTPDKCDPDLSFDAVTELQQEIVFFKERYVNCPSTCMFTSSGVKDIGSRLLDKNIIEMVFVIIFCLFRFMWRKHPQFDETGITLINSLWPESVPSFLDAVYQDFGSNLIVFFKGKMKKHPKRASWVVYDAL